jgi:signal transduction histidine kinase
MPTDDSNSEKNRAPSDSSGLNASIPKPFQLLRYFFLTSLLIILMTAILMQFIYRRAAVDTLITLGETTNISLAQMALSSIRPQLFGYLAQMANATPEDAANQVIPQDLNQAMQRLIYESSISRIKVYNPQGVVVYSTLSKQIGQDQADNQGVQKALSGQTISKLIYRDSFNTFDKEDSESNLIQTYLPAFDNKNGIILGAMEIYFDAFFLVEQTEHSQLLMLAMLSGVFLLMFVLLVAAVWRPASVMARQDYIIRERTHMLEFLSAQMLSDQEIEKKNIAQGLHESVAQTLCGVKMRLETMAREVKKDSPLIESFNSLGGYLQDAISETSNIAMRLRPSSLDQIGLIGTLEDFRNDLIDSNPKFSIALQIDPEVESISQSLKVIIYRIVQETLNNLATQSEADKAELVLRSTKDAIELEIKENSNPYSKVSGSTGERRVNKTILPMRERTLLSGGHFSTSQSGLNRTHKSHWDL